MAFARVVSFDGVTKQQRIEASGERRARQRASQPRLASRPARPARSEDALGEPVESRSAVRLGPAALGPRPGGMCDHLEVV